MSLMLIFDLCGSNMAAGVTFSATFGAVELKMSF